MENLPQVGLDPFLHEMLESVQELLTTPVIEFEVVPENVHELAERLPLEA